MFIEYANSALGNLFSQLRPLLGLFGLDELGQFAGFGHHLPVSLELAQTSVFRTKSDQHESGHVVDKSTFDRTDFLSRHLDAFQLQIFVNHPYCLLRRPCPREVKRSFLALAISFGFGGPFGKHVPDGCTALHGTL